MRGLSSIALTLLLMTAVAPLALADVGDDNPLALYITCPEGRSDIGSEVTVYVHVFREGARHDPDELGLKVSFEDSERNLTLVRQDAGLYNSTFTILEEMVSWSEVYLSATASDNPPLQQSETAEAYNHIDMVDTGLDLNVLIPDPSDETPRPGQTVEFEVLVMFRGTGVDPDPGTFEVRFYDAGTGMGAPLDVTRLGTGRYEGALTIPAGVTESTEYEVDVDAEYTLGSKTYSAGIGRPIPVRFYEPWVHYVDVSTSQATIEVWAMGTDGLPMAGAGVSLTYSYNDDHSNTQEKTVTGTIDDAGMASLELDYATLGEDESGVWYEGYVEYGGLRENFRGSMEVRYQFVDDWEDYGFYVGLLTEQPLPLDSQVELHFKATDDNVPLQGADVSAYIYDSSRMLLSGVYRTDSLGEFTATIRTPATVPEDDWPELECEFSAKVRGLWEHSDTYILYDPDFVEGFPELTRNIDPDMTITVAPFKAGGDVRVTLECPDADGIDERAFYLWGVGSMDELTRTHMPDWSPLGGDSFLWMSPFAPMSWADGAYRANFTFPSFLPEDVTVHLFCMLGFLDSPEEDYRTAMLDGVAPLPPNPRPLATVTLPVAGAQYGGLLKVEGTASDDTAVERVEVRVDTGDWVTVDGTAQWSHEVDTSELTSTTHLVEVRSFDGERYSTVVRVVFEVDQPPAVAVTVPEEGQTFNGTARFNGTASDDISVDHVECRLDGEEWSVAFGSTAWSVELGTTVLTAGRHTFEARSSDGEQTSGIVKVRFYVDQPPTVAMTGHEDGKRYVGAVALAGTATDDIEVKRVEVRVDGGGWAVCDGIVDWTYVVPTAGLAEGTHTLEVRAWDGGAYSDVHTTSFVFEKKRPADTPGPGALLALAAMGGTAVLLCSRRRRRS